MCHINAQRLMSGVACYLPDSSDLLRPIYGNDVSGGPPSL